VSESWVVQLFLPLCDRADIRYEVAWIGWKRLDGTNTTWMPNIYDRPDLVSSWKRKQNKIRRDNVEESLDIAVRHDIDVHNDNTSRRAEAFAEKMDKRRRRNVGYKQWDLELEKNIDRLHREMGEGSESRSRSLRGNYTRTIGSAHPRAPSVTGSVVSISSALSSNKHPSGSQVNPSLANGPSSSRSATLSSTSGKASSSAGSQRPMTSQEADTESRPSRPLPRRATLLAPATATPSR
jgi:hypothetical protein